MIPIKFNQTDSTIIENNSACISDVEGFNWYYMPFWFKKIGDNIFEQHSFEELPPELKDRIQDLREDSDEESLSGTFG